VGATAISNPAYNRRKNAAAALANYLGVLHKPLAVTACQTSGYDDDLLPRYNDTTTVAIAVVVPIPNVLLL